MTGRDRKTGRPVKTVEGEGQVTIGMRVPAELKRELERIAEDNHRTLSHEAERRLERSLNPEMLLDDAALQLRQFSQSIMREGIRMTVEMAYGKSEADVGTRFMELLSLVRQARADRATVGIKRADLDFLRDALKEIEEGATVNE